MPSLFDPIRLGAITARNRIFMAPLTRAHATMDHVPTPMMTEYYRQRAGAGGKRGASARRQHYQPCRRTVAAASRGHALSSTRYSGPQARAR